MRSNDSGQSPDEGKNGFPAVLHRMIQKVSKSSPELMGWSYCGSMFRFDPYSDAEAMRRAIAPFFAHGNFASMRRQLSAYQFLRKGTGQNQGFWYHPLFHKKSTDEDFSRIQKGRRRRKSDFKSQQVDSPGPKTAPVSRDVRRGAAPLANIDLNTNRARYEKVQGRSFPVILHEMLNTLSAEHPNIIVWTGRGNTFFLDQNMVVNHAATIKTFFPHENFASIRRQLSVYGFRRLSGGELKGSWYHPSFTSQKMDLHTSDRRPRGRSISADSDSMASCEEQSDFIDSSSPIAAINVVWLGVGVKRDVLSKYFCKSCLYMEGKICCNNCPAKHHKDCKTSRCMRGCAHLN